MEDTAVTHLSGLPSFILLHLHLVLLLLLSTSATGSGTGSCIQRDDMKVD